MRPRFQTQENPYDHPDSKWMFDPHAEIAVTMTPSAKAIYGDYAFEPLAILTGSAKRHGGLDRLQVFLSLDPKVEDLGVREAEDAIVFHLRSEYWVFAVRCCCCCGYGIE